MPGFPVENVTLSNVRLRFRGGGTAEDAAREILEHPEAYPEFNMFGVLPAYGFYVRHAKNVRFHHLDLSFEQEDVRPALVLDDVEDADVFGLRAQVAPAARSMIWLKQVRGAMVHGCRPHGRSKTFVRLDGERSSGVTVMNNDLGNVEQALAVGKAVTADAAYVAGNRIK